MADRKRLACRGRDPEPDHRAGGKYRVFGGRFPKLNGLGHDSVDLSVYCAPTLGQIDGIMTKEERVGTIASKGQLRMSFLRWAVVIVPLILLLGWAIHFDKSTHVVSTLAWMIVFCATLTVVTPSAEQMTKMLAQVAAIRAGAKVEP